MTKREIQFHIINNYYAKYSPELNLTVEEAYIGYFEIILEFQGYIEHFNPNNGFLSVDGIKEYLKIQGYFLENLKTNWLRK